MKLKVCMLIACLAMVAAFAPAKQPNQGTLGPPTDFMVTQNSDNLFFSWMPVRGATKYAVPVWGVVTYSDGTARQQVRFKVGFNTAGCIGTVYERSGRVVLEIPKATMARIVLARLQAAGVDPATVEAFLLEATAKVKAMNPGRRRGPQNNPFSNTDDFELLWRRPSR